MENFRHDNTNGYSEGQLQVANEQYDNAVFELDIDEDHSAYKSVCDNISAKILAGIEQSVEANLSALRRQV